MMQKNENKYNKDLKNRRYFVKIYTSMRIENKGEIFLRRKKILSIFLVSSITLGVFSGCDVFDKVSNGINNKEPITFTLFSSELGSRIAFDDDVAKEITKRTGVVIDLYGDDTGFSKPIDLMIAKEEYPDLIYAKGDTDKLIDARAIISLDKYIEEKGDNIKALYGDQLKRLKYSTEDESIYTSGTYGVSTVQWSPEGTMQMQYAVLKELGYPKINTIYDYEKALKDYIEKYPEINGEKTIGLSLMASDWRWLITVGNRASMAAGIPDDGQFKIDDQTGEATYKFQIPEVKEYLKWLNNLNAEGLLDPESFTQSQDDYIGKIERGVVLGISDSSWDYNSAVINLANQGKLENTFAPLSVTINESVKDQSLKDYGFSGGWGVAITKSCKDPERAFEFIDWMASDEAQVLLNWGIEGKHYKVENGKRVLLPEVQEQKQTDAAFAHNTGITKYTVPFPQRGDGAVDPTGNYYTTNSLENYINSYNEVEKQTLSAYGAKSWVELFPSSEELGISKHGQQWQYNIPTYSDMSIIQTKADEYVQEAVTKAILGPAENFDSAWDEIQNSLKEMGIEKVNQGMTELTKEKIKLWNEN